MTVCWLPAPDPLTYTTASREALNGFAVTIGSRLRFDRLVGRGLTRYSPRTDQLPEAVAGVVALVARGMAVDA